MNNPNHIRSENTIGSWLRYHFVEKKLSSWFGVFVLSILALGVAYAGAEVDYRLGLGVTFIFMGVFFVMLFLKHPYFALYFLIVFSCLPNFIDRILWQHPISINYVMVIYSLVLIMWISIFGKSRPLKLEESDFGKNPVTWSLILPLIFYVTEALNPNMFSLAGWLSFFLRNLIFFVSFYALFILLNSWKRTKYFIHFNIILITLLAAYSCKQQWFGLTDFEMKWATDPPDRYWLLFQGGFLRKWSTLSDPAAAGVIFSSVAVLCIVLALRERKRMIKIWLGVASVFNLLGYTYSGTRTGTLIIVGGVVFYGVATLFETRTLIFLGGAVGFFVCLMISPWSPPSVSRIKSTFEGTKDASAAVRDYNRHTVQPYLYSHPMGGGVYTSGFEGPKYNPGHFLENFQPDSGYMKTFAEQGWVGLLVMLITYFMILSHTLRNFYKSSDPELQNYCIALISMIFSVMVGQYSQFAMNLYPQVFFYLGALVFFIKMPYFEKLETNQQTLTT